MNFNFSQNRLVSTRSSRVRSIAGLFSSVNNLLFCADKFAFKFTFTRIILNIFPLITYYDFRTIDGQSVGRPFPVPRPPQQETTLRFRRSTLRTHTRARTTHAHSYNIHSRSSAYKYYTYTYTRARIQTVHDTEPDNWTLLNAR